MQAMTQIAMRPPSDPCPLVARDPAPASHYTFSPHTAHTAMPGNTPGDNYCDKSRSRQASNIAICTTLNTNDRVSILYHA